MIVNHRPALSDWHDSGSLAQIQPQTTSLQRSCLLGIDFEPNHRDSQDIERLLAWHMVELSKNLGCYKISVRCPAEKVFHCWLCFPKICLRILRGNFFQVDFYFEFGLRCEPNNSNALVVKFVETDQTPSAASELSDDKSVINTVTSKDLHQSQSTRVILDMLQLLLHTCCS